MGGYLEYCGGVQYRGGYHDKCGGYHEYRGVILSTVGIFSTVGDIMMHVGDIMMHMGDIMMHMGDIFSTMEGVQYRGGSLLLFEYPMVLNTPYGTHDIPPHAS